MGISERSLINFENWKQKTGLDAEFPNLLPINRMDMQSFVRTEEMDSMLDEISSNEATMIKVNPGGGATTLFEYLVSNNGKQDAEDKSLDVPINIEDDGAPNTEKLVHSIYWNILKELIDKADSGKRNNPILNRILNFRETADGPAAGISDDFIVECKKNLNSIKDSSLGLKKRYPFFTQDPYVVINFLLEKLVLNTRILYLFPRTLEYDEILRLERAIKDVFEEKNGVHYLHAAKKEIFLCTPEIASVFNQSFKREIKTIKFRQYQPNEIWLMLEKRYSAKKLLHSESLNTVFSDKVIQKVFKQGAPIKDTIKNIEDWIYAKMDCDPVDVRIRLEWEEA
jgi:hypothetical protein